MAAHPARRRDPSPAHAILAMAPNPWHGPWMNRQQLLSRLAAGGADIVYTTGQWFSWHRHDPAWRSAPALGRTERVDGIRLAYAPRWLLRVPRWPGIDRLSLTLEARRLRGLFRRGSYRPLTLYIFHPAYQPYALALRPERLVYHAYDLFELMPGWSAEMARNERWLLAHADLRIASSSVTAARHEAIAGKPVHTLPNAADTRRFHQACREPEPADLAAIPHPRIGYVGSINDKVDLALIAELARRRPGWHFVLVGAVGRIEAEAAALTRCRAMPNVHELGAKPYGEVPGYVAHIDVGLIPYRVRPDLWTIAAEPLKLYEYLAAGRPVVARATTSIERFGEAVVLADGPDDWETAIERLTAPGSSPTASCIDAIAGHDWSDRVTTLKAWLPGTPARETG